MFDFTQQLLSWQWGGDLLVLLPAAWLSYVCCWVWLRRKGNHVASVGRLVCWTAGLLFIPIAVLSAIDALADVSLTVHMVQHVLLIYVAAPLLLLGRPLSIWRMAFPRKGAKQVAAMASAFENSIARGLNFILKPYVAWGLSTAVLIIWHVPGLYDYALAHENVHEYGEHLTFFLTFLAWWHPLLGSIPRFPYLSISKGRFIYLLAGMIPMISLGVFILFYPGTLYSFYTYATPLDGLRGMVDQEVGAGVMLASGMIVLFSMALPLQYVDRVPLSYP